MKRPGGTSGSPAESPPARARGRVAGVLGILALGLLLYVAWPNSRPPEPGPSRNKAAKSDDAKSVRPTVRPMRATTAASTDAPAPSASADDGWDPANPPGADTSTPKPAPSSGHYPPGSQPLTELVDPMSQNQEDDTVDAAQGINCVFGPRISIVHDPKPLVIDLEVRGKLGAKMPITQGVARFRADGTTIEKGPWFSTPLVDDGSGSDLASGDLAFTATFLPTAEQRAAFYKGGTHVFVEVSFEAPNNLGSRKYSTVMQYSRMPSASLNGKYSDAIEQGSLVVQAGVTAEKAGDFRVIGSLFGAEDAPIAFASKAMHLEAGDGNVPLLFFGKILHDRGLDGPYELREVMLFEEIIGVEIIPGEKVAHAYTTKEYRAEDFSPESYVAPASNERVVDMNDPSQKDKPPPLHGDADRTKLSGNTAPIKADPAGKQPSVTFRPGTPGYGK